MFTNDTATLYVKGIDTEKRLPVWTERKIGDVYREICRGQTSVSNQGGSHEMKQQDTVFVSIPKKNVPAILPKCGDFISFGEAASMDNAFTVMTVEDYRYGSEAVQHVEVVAG